MSQRKIPPETESSEEGGDGGRSWPGRGGGGRGVGGGSLHKKPGRVSVTANNDRLHNLRRFNGDSMCIHFGARFSVQWVYILNSGQGIRVSECCWKVWCAAVLMSTRVVLVN